MVMTTTKVWRQQWCWWYRDQWLYCC